jgi:hypothetical protein
MREDAVKLFAVHSSHESGNCTHAEILIQHVFTFQQVFPRKAEPGSLDAAIKR